MSSADVDAAVGAFGEGFFDGLFHAFGTHGEGDDFAAVFFFEAEGFFEGVAVGLVHFEADVGFFDPVSGDGEWSVFGGDLFDADDDVHWFSPCCLKVDEDPPSKTEGGAPASSSLIFVESLYQLTIVSY